MKTAYAATALALLFGLGTAITTPPALAQQPGGAGVAGGGAGESGAVHPMEAHPARPDIVAQCDAEGTGFVTTEQARACYEEHFGAISGGASHLTLEQFELGMPEAADAPTTFAQIDRDGDGQISREEWLAWREQGFAEVAPEGRMPAEDYAGWHLGAAD